jgi:hypothetical protein
MPGQSHCEQDMQALTTLLVLLFIPAIANGQVIVGGSPAGSTVAGDRLRGEGEFLKGAAWYQLNSAKATSINVDSTIRWNEELRRQYEANLNDAIARNVRKGADKALKDQEVKRRQSERQHQLRVAPTTADVESGDALNALLVDLANPTIASTLWQASRVELPATISVKELVFRFTPKPGSKGTEALSAGVIAIARLDMKGKWPTVLSSSELSTQKRQYEEAYERVRQLTFEGQFELDAILRLDSVLDTLKSRVTIVVPTQRGFRDEAIKVVNDLKDATRMFDAQTIDYAREIIRDTASHDAGTVQEQKYRLMFASAERSPEARVLYPQLRELMAQQLKLLGIPIEAIGADLVQPNTVWTNEKNTFTILERKGESFRGTFSAAGYTREVVGSIKDGKLVWLAKDVRVIKGNDPGGDNYGTINGERIEFEHRFQGAPRGTFVLYLKKGGA